MEIKPIAKRVEPQSAILFPISTSGAITLLGEIYDYSGFRNWMR